MEDCKSLTKHFDQKQFLETWNTTKAGLRKTEESLQKFVEAETKEELKAVEEAMNNYQKKMKQVVEKKEFIKLKNDAECYSKQVEAHLTKAISIFEKERRKIVDDPKKTPAEKQKLVEKIHNYIISKLYTPEEIDDFRRHTITFLIK